MSDAPFFCMGCDKPVGEALVIVSLRGSGGYCDECIRLAGAIVDEQLATMAFLAAYREAQSANPASFSDEMFVARILAVIRAERAVMARRTGLVAVLKP